MIPFAACRGMEYYAKLATAPSRFMVKVAIFFEFTFIF